MGTLWPCLVYSSSLESAKIVANSKSGLIQKLQEANQAGSLKFCFTDTETGNPLIFFVAVRSMGYAPYGGTQDMIIIHLQFTQRPPDDLIVIMGRILDADANSAQRRGDRILVTTDTQRKLQLASQNVAISIQGIPRQCILRDISFYGAKVVIMGLAKFLEEREVVLTIDFDEPMKSFSLKGRFIRSEVVAGRQELVAMAISFDESLVPIGYKIRINNYITQVRADNRSDQVVRDPVGAEQ
ncbi:MAG: pilus assembly protein PilZ [Treponema sp.]|nr:pilus assembly protein PilZ [Treponema sp.]